jgi:DNA-binding GntR family transcriptional regulator
MEKRAAAGGSDHGELLKRYDWEFHQALLSACGSKVLLEAHGEIFDKYFRYLIIAVVFRGEIAVGEHRQLLDYALARDAKAAQAVLVKHIQECVTFTLSNGRLGPRPEQPRAESRRKMTAPA